MAEMIQDGALAGVRVIDLSRVLGGPYATQILGDHGADIIKIEPPQGDETREWGPPFQGDPDGGRGASAYYVNINRNKRDLALDLTKEAAREVLLRLLGDADVLVENFKSGTMERWGLGAADLARRFPRLVYARVTGFGDAGPFGGFPGYDAVVQTMSGLSSANGTEASGPIKLGVPMVDMASGLNLVIGILLALRARDSSGRGQTVEVALYDTGLSILHPHSGNWLMGGTLPKRTGNAHPNVAPYDLFQTATRPLFLGVGNDGQFKKACRVLGRDDLASDPRFTSMAGRNTNRAALTAILSEALSQADGTALARAFLEAGVPAGTLNDVAEALSDPQTQVREMVIETEGYRGIASPIKLSRDRARLRRVPPRFNADGAQILAEAGYSDQEIQALIEAGAVMGKPEA
ncbi:MAG: CoA transferase [Alphaproteobacteria bacterium]|nr:CoA transferase [Alphaproteobacteria bacterium]